MLQSLLLIECQMANFDKEPGKGMDVIKEQIVKFCDQSNSSDQIDLEKLIRNLAVSFKKDIPKIIDEMRRAETTANPRLAKLQSYVEAINMLRLLNQKLEPNPTKAVVSKVLNKNAVDIMPSELPHSRLAFLNAGIDEVGHRLLICQIYCKISF
uniref:VHS domain-containing protein n=1 Tax=Globodera pallida TaxID=36090 RepID=A0A183CIS8_GLOPA